MSYNYNLNAKKIQITEETLQILNLLDIALKKYATDLPMVNEDIHEEKGIWYAFVAKVETATGTSLGATYKTLPQKDILLDAFARTLLEDVRIYITELLEDENISSDEITQTKITNKYVLIKEILIRLISHALSIGIGMFSQGEALLNMTDDFIQRLNSSDIMAKKQFLGNKNSSSFGMRLTNNIDYWLKLLSNSVKVSELIHKNTHACGSCLNLLLKLRMITLRQIIAFLDATQLTSSYDDEMLPLKLKKFFAKYKISGLDEIINKYKNVDSSFQEENFLYLNNKSIECKDRLKKLFFLLAEITNLETIFGQLSTITSALGWFPVITGTLELTPLMQRLELLFEQAKTDLKVDLESKHISIQEKSILQHYSSYSTPSNLETSFIIAAKNLEDLTNAKIMNKLMHVLKFSTTHLINLQNELGIIVINENKLNNLLKSCNESVVLNTQASLRDSSARNDSIRKYSNDKLFISEKTLNINSKPSKAKFFLEQTQPHISSNTSCVDYNDCIVQIDNQLLKYDNTYTLFQVNNKNWTLLFYKNLDAQPKNIVIHEVPDLVQMINKNDEKMIVEVIISYHISISLKKIFDKGKYVMLLNYIDKNNIHTKRHSWLAEIAMLYQAKCCCALFKESGVVNTSQNTLKLVEMDSAIFAIEQKNNIKSENECRLF